MKHTEWYENRDSKLEVQKKKYLRVERKYELVNKRKVAKIKNLIFRNPRCQEEHREDCKRIRKKTRKLLTVFIAQIVHALKIRIKV
jgi:hypothetical protein